LGPNGYNEEEMKLVHETHKIWGYFKGTGGSVAADPFDLPGAPKISATCVRVPVMLGLGMALNIAFDRPINERDAREALRRAPGISLLDRRDDGGYASPAEIVGEDMVYVSRIRRDETLAHGLSLWIVGDDVRLGAALNAARLAEAVLKD
jgi:aspartate-semialdehyde dehydrogenase